MDLFEEISKAKEELPRVDSIQDEVSQFDLNVYQLFAIGLFIIFFFLGIVFGSLFSTCGTTSYYYVNTCAVKEFNYSVMIFIWFGSLILSTAFFAMGHIIALLGQINEKLKKN